MATQLFLVTSGQSNTDADTHRGTNTAKLNGSANGWLPKPLSLTRGGSGGVSSTSTVAGPTNGVECQNTTGGFPLEFISPPVTADVTISGTITANLWAREASMTDNVAINIVVDIIRATDNSIVQIVKSSFVTELGTSIAVNNFTTGMTSGAYTGQTVNRGDRIRIRVFGDDVGTMGGGSSFVFDYAGNTAAADGDSYVTFTENFAFDAAPGAEVASITQIATNTGEHLNGGAALGNGIAQSFVAPASGSLTQVKVGLDKTGSPTDNVVVEIRSNSGSSPSSTVLASASMGAASISATAAMYSFSVPVSLTPSATYWIVLTRSGSYDLSNYITWESSTADPYASGGASVWTGSVWSPVSGEDMQFIVYALTVTGTTLYLTDTASAVSTASVDKEAWTSRGGGVSSIVTNTVNGFTSPVQMTDSAGGTVVDWFSRPLQAFTLGGLAQANIRALISNASANVSLRMEIARVDGDGTSPTVWGSWCVKPAGTDAGEITVGEDVRTANVSGDDLAFTDGQRIRIRMYLDDLATTAMASGFTATLRYGGSALGSGDTYVVLPVTLTEFSSGPFDYLDSATITVDLQSSGSELIEAVETATVPMLMSVSAVETREIPDSATVLLDLQSSGTELQEAIDTATVPLVLTPSGVEVTSTSTLWARLSLEAGGDPGIDTGHYLSIRARKTNAAHQGTIRAQLWDGATNIGPVLETGNLTTSFATYSLAIASGDVASISSYGDLELRIQGFSVNADPTVFEVAESCLLTPTPAVGGIDYLDSGTVYLDLVSSGTDLHEIPDAATVYLDIVSSGTELQEFVEAASVYVDIETSGVEIHEIPDSASVYLDIQSSGTELLEVVESASVYLDLTSSGTDLHEIPDAATVYVDILSTGVELQEVTDAASVYLDILASGSDIQVSDDNATAYVDIQVASAELAEAVEAATVYVDISSSGTELLEAVDTASVYVDLQSSGTEQREITDTATVYADITVASSELQEAVEAASVYLDLDASGTDTKSGETLDSGTVYLDLNALSVELQEAADTASVYLDIQSSGTEVQEAADTASVYFDLQSSGTEFKEILESATVYLDMQPSTFTEIEEVVEAAEIYVDLQASGTEFQGTGNQDTAEVYFDLQTSTAEALVAVEADIVYLDLQSSGTEIQEATDANSVYLDLTVQSQEEFGKVDSATVPLDISTTGVELAQYIEAQTVYLDIDASSIEVVVVTDSATVPLLLTPSSTEEYTRLDSASVYFDLTVASVEVVERVDSSTVYVDLQPASTDVGVVVELGTIYLDLDATGIETVLHGYVDTAIVYLDIRIGALQIDFVLEIVGVTSRWTYTLPICTVRWDIPGVHVRWDAVEMLARWTLLEQRRFTWKS